MRSERDRTTSGESVPLRDYIAGMGGWNNYLAYTGGVTPSEDEEFRRIGVTMRAVRRMIASDEARKGEQA